MESYGFFTQEELEKDPANRRLKEGCEERRACRALEDTETRLLSGPQFSDSLSATAHSPKPEDQKITESTIELEARDLFMDKKADIASSCSVVRVKLLASLGRLRSFDLQSGPLLRSPPGLLTQSICSQIFFWKGKDSDSEAKATVAPYRG